MIAKIMEMEEFLFRMLVFIYAEMLMTCRKY